MKKLTFWKIYKKKVKNFWTRKRYLEAFISHYSIFIYVLLRLRWSDEQPSIIEYFSHYHSPGKSSSNLNENEVKRGQFFFNVTELIFNEIIALGKLFLLRAEDIFFGSGTHGNVRYLFSFSVVVFFSSGETKDDIFFSLSECVCWVKFW